MTHLAPTSQTPRGTFVSFEGPEGSGKSTQISLLARRLQSAGLKVLLTREPGGTAIGEQIRHLLKHHASGNNMCAETELLLFAASRAQLVREVMRPALARGETVLCDRFLDSSTVYQGSARNLAGEPIAAINDFAVADIVPDLTVVIDVPAEESLQRIRKRASDVPDRMERENIEFYRKVREGYLVLARSLPARFRVVDGTRDEDTVAAAVWEAVAPLFV